MLRITTRSGSEAITFLVEGRLVGGWAQELARAWNQAADGERNRARIVDLSETQFVDGDGRKVLTDLFRDGAFFRTACPMMESIIAEITGKPESAPKARRKWRGPALPAGKTT